MSVPGKRDKDVIVNPELVGMCHLNVSIDGLSVCTLSKARKWREKVGIFKIEQKVQ